MSIFFQVRHPNILSFLHSTEAETLDGSSAKVTIYIVTEPVMPLAEKVKELGLEGSQRWKLKYFLIYSCKNFSIDIIFFYANL